MSAGKFIKENFALIAGLALPVMVMAVFFVSTALPRMAAEPPPKYDMLFAVDKYNYNSHLPVTTQFLVKDGELKIQYTKNSGSRQDWKKLYIYKAATQSVQELPLPYPDNLADIKSTLTETVAATKGMKINPSTKAPDGYELDIRYRYRGGIMPELFWGSSSRRSTALEKNGTRHELKQPHSNSPFYLYPNSTDFIGWVIP